MVDLNQKLCVLLQDRAISRVPLSFESTLYLLQLVLHLISSFFSCYSSTFNIVLMTNCTLQASHDVEHCFSSWRLFEHRASQLLEVPKPSAVLLGSTRGVSDPIDADRCRLGLLVVCVWFYAEVCRTLASLTS